MRLSMPVRLGYGLFTAAGLLLFVELIAHRVLGKAPPSDAVERVAQCSLRTEGERTWMECGHVREDMFTATTAKGERKRVAILGGSSVRDPFKAVAGDDFPEHLQRLLPEIEVLNLGKAGMSMSGVAWITSQMGPLQPDLVVLYEGHNDFAQTVFRGGIHGTRLWMVPIQRVLAKSWIHAWLARAEQGVETTHPRDAGPQMIDPDRPLECEGLPGNVRRGVSFVSDDTALRVRDQVVARYREDVRTAIRESPAPVVVSTLLRNFDHPPSGALAAADSRCRLALSCLGNEGIPDPGALVRYAEVTCGTDAAITWWLRAHRDAAAGRTAEAVDAWGRSLALDPLPLRAPLDADVILREVAGEEGARVLDLEQTFGPLPDGKWFTDTLHPSSEGAQAIAAALAPVVQEALR